MIPSFTLNGKRSGETLKLPADGTAVPEADFAWRFPLAFAEVITGDGKGVSRDRIALENAGPFGTRKLRISLKFAGQKWARLEVWDVVAKGAFTQPVRIDE